MRALTLFAVCAAFVLAVPASAGGLDPRALVLQQADVPAGFQLDRAQSGIQTNTDLRDDAFVARSGRITGYLAQYVQRQPSSGVQSRVDLFRRPAGARMMLAKAKDWWRRFGQGEPPPRRGQIGAESWIFGGFVDTVVIWRYGRAYALVLGVGMTKQRTLALARAQQRRIAAALG
jgi:hypothetical protein